MCYSIINCKERLFSNRIEKIKDPSDCTNPVINQAILFIGTIIKLLPPSAGGIFRFGHLRCISKFWFIVCFIVVVAL